MPHVFGVGVGFTLMTFLLGLGLDYPFRTYPLLQDGLKILGAAYLVYLAWILAKAGAPGEGETRPKPITFLQAALFQWLNPKAWMMAIAGIGAFTVKGEAYMVSLYQLCLIFFVVSVPCCIFWVAVGHTARLLLQTEKLRRIFNVTMSVLTLATVATLFL